jgi:DNA-binding transcriptional LysR family regulator
MAIEFRHLRHLLTVAEHGSFSRAAQVLHLTQPALSRSIKALEAALGAPVFERGRAGVEPTEVGRLVMRHAQAMDLASHDLFRELGMLQDMEQGELRLGAGPFGGAALVGPVLGRLHRLHPRLRISVVLAPWKELPARVQSRELDLIVSELSELQLLEEFDTLPLTLERLVVVCRAGHPLASRAAPTVREVLSCGLAGPTMPLPVQRALAAAAHPGQRTRAAQAPTVAITCDSHAVIADVLRASDAVSMMPWFMARDGVDSGTLAVLPGVDLGATARFGAGWVKSRPLSSAARKFLQLLRDYDAALVASQLAVDHKAVRPVRQATPA